MEMKNKNPFAVKAKELVGKNTILIIFLVIIAVASIFLKNFRTIDNVLMIARQFSMVGIIAMGQAIVLISGGFDLSVGAIASLCGMASAYAAVFLGWPLWLCILIPILLGGICGVFNGVLVSIIKINPLIATLASGWVFSGIILVATKGWPITGLPKPFLFLGQGRLFNIPLPIILMIAICIILTIFLSKTYFGRYLYALGGSEKTSLFVGINVDLVKLSAYVIAGALAGFAGLILTSRMGTAQAGAADAWTLPSIAAAVIGGIMLGGGKGSIYGVIVGAALMGVIGNILVLFQISSYWQTLVTGFILIIAVAIDALRNRTSIA